MGTSRLLIHMYLPSGMIPGELDGMDADDFIRLAGLARCARRWRQDDLEQGFTRALGNLFQESKSPSHRKTGGLPVSLER